MTYVDCLYVFKGFIIYAGTGGWNGKQMFRVVPIFQISKWATTQPFCFSLSRKAASQIFYRYYGAVLLPSAAAHALAARSLRAHREVSKALATRGSELSFHLVIIIDQ